MPEQPPNLLQRARTKIVVTVGPASCTKEQLAGLLEAGADVFRINTAHGDRDQHQQQLSAIREVEAQLGQPVAVLVDLAGPKIRLGELPGGEIDCAPDAEFTFVRGDTAIHPGELVTNYDRLIDDLAVGDRVMLADGTVGFVVEERSDDRARCRVVQPGLIRSRQGVNLPGVKLGTPSLTAADRENAAWAAGAGVDLVGLSFVRTTDEINELKRLLTEAGSTAKVVAKIEKPEALSNLDAIVTAADGAMVARGDLGVEIDVARIAVEQKRIISVCNRMQKPVIVATQMLDSMQHNRLPTRAEATDVANAVLDGADACMLSGETAIGAHPRAAVEMMHRIALSTEEIFRELPPQAANTTGGAVDDTTQAVVNGADRIARQLNARLLVVASHSGATALALAGCRNFAPTLGLSDRESTLRQMCLYWGVTPLVGAPTRHSAELVQFVEAWGRRDGSLAAGDRIVILRGSGLARDVQNTLVVHHVAD